GWSGAAAGGPPGGSRVVAGHAPVAVDGGVALSRDRAQEVHLWHVEPEQRAVAAPRRGLASDTSRVALRHGPKERAVEARDDHGGGGAPRRGVRLLERVAGLEPGVIGQVPVDGRAV